MNQSRIIIALLLTAATAYAGPRWRIFQDASTNVTARYEHSLSRYAPFEADEVARKSYDYQFPRDLTGVETNNIGGEVTTNNVYTAVPSKHWKWDGSDVLAMTQPERDAKDAWIAQIAAAAEAARIAAAEDLTRTDGEESLKVIRRLLNRLAQDGTITTNQAKRIMSGR